MGLQSISCRVLHSLFCILHYFVGGEYRDRTGDLLLARQALSQLSYIPISYLHLLLEKCGGPEWARTTDLTIISRTL